MSNVITDPQLLAAFEAEENAGVNDPQAQREMRDREIYSQAFDNLPWYQQFGVGIAKPVVETVEGFKDWTGLGEVDQQALMAMQEADSGWATGGEVAGDIATMLIPAGGALRATQAAMKAKSALPTAAALLGVEAGVTGAYEGNKAPDTSRGETRAENALTAAALTAAFGAGQIGLSAAINRMIDKPVRELLDAGVPLTVGMSHGEKAAAIERFLTNMPVVGRKVEQMQDNAMQGWNKHLLEQTSGAPVPSAGHEGFKQAQKNLSDRYKQVWSEVDPSTFDVNRQAAKVIDAFTNEGKYLTDEGMKYARKHTDKFLDVLQKYEDFGMTSFLDRADDLLRQAQHNAPDDITAKMIADIRTRYRNGISPRLNDDLTATDTDYFKFKTLEEAGAYIKPQEQGAVFTPRSLESAVKKRSSPSQTTKGNAPMQDEAALATSTIGRVLPERSQINVGKDIGKWAGLAGLIAAPISTTTATTLGKAMTSETMNRLLTGRMPNVSDIEMTRILRMMGINANENTDTGY